MNYFTKEWYELCQKTSIHFSFREVKEAESFSGEYLLILFDNKVGFTDVDEVKFENYKIIKQDDLLQNSWWLYDEIYKINNKYESHVLLQNKKMDLVDFIISADNITFSTSNIL